MSHPKSRQVGTAGLVLRHRDGTCRRGCRRCGQRETAPGWRAGLRAARAHAAEHAAADARYIGTPWGVPAHELAPARGRLHVGRLAAVALVVLVVAFTLTALNVSSHAAPAPAPPAPSIAIVPTTLPAGSGEYVPTPAGPSAPDAGGTWIPEPDPAWPASPSSSSAGGGR